MTFSLKNIFETNQSQQHELFAEYVNPQLMRVLKTIGFAKTYVRAEGCYLYDEKGNDYLDFLAGYGVFNMGRNHPVVRAAVEEALQLQAASMVQMDGPLLAGVLAKKLLEKVAGKPEMVFFTNSGTEAVEGALKFARKATGRERILFLEHSFHGLTTGSLAVGGNTEFRNGFGNLLPGCKGLHLGDLAGLKAELQKGDVAAFIFEPAQGKGVYFAEPAYYQEAERLCREYGALMIADEVQSGLGRTGKWFAHQHFGITPDIVTTAKALSGGYVPCGAICYPKWVYQKVFRSMEECVVHSNTFGRGAVACAAGLASLHVLETENLVENSARQGAEIVSRVSAFQNKYEMLKSVRGLGLMIGFEFAEPKSFGLKAGWKIIHKLNSGLFGQMVVVPLMRDHRILTQVAGHSVDIVKILPPLCIGEKEVSRFVNGFEQVMQACHTFPGAAWSVGKDLAIAAARSRNMAPSSELHEL